MIKPLVLERTGERHGIPKAIVGALHPRATDAPAPASAPATAAGATTAATSSRERGRRDTLRADLLVPLPPDPDARREG